MTPSLIKELANTFQKDGIEIITEFSTIKKIPVVYLTAYSDSEIINRAEKTMPFAYLLKPYNENQLKATINLAILNFKKSENSIPEQPENTIKLKLLTLYVPNFSGVVISCPRVPEAAIYPSPTKGVIFLCVKNK